MKTAQFTPGPWGVKSTDEDINTKTIVDGSEFWIARVLNFNHASDDIRESRANATLIAAAPAMYEALTALLAEEDIVSIDSGPDECRWCGRTYPDIDNEGELQVLCASDDCPGYIARQAIAQAEGK